MNTQKHAVEQRQRLAAALRQTARSKRSETFTPANRRRTSESTKSGEFPVLSALRWSVQATNDDSRTQHGQTSGRDVLPLANCSNHFRSATVDTPVGGRYVFR